MSVHKDLGRLVSDDGALIGKGRAYLHLRLSETERQQVQGTLSLDWWDADWTGQRARLELASGPTLTLHLESDKFSACINGRVLRYQAEWPGLSSTD
jgi:hypothetical protein